MATRKVPLCQNCNKAFGAHGVFGRCTGGQTQYEAHPETRPATHAVWKVGDRVRIKPDGNRHHAYCAHFGIGEVEGLTYSRISVRFEGAVIRKFKAKSLLAAPAAEDPC